MTHSGEGLSINDRQELWIEKYRPKTTADIIGNDKNLQTIKQWFVDFKNKKPGLKRALLFGGAPGLGKTSLAHVILSEEGYQIKEYNASDIRSKRLVHTNLDQLINMDMVDKIIDKDFLPIGIIMDEVDGMSAGDKGGMAELIQFINPNRGQRSVKKEDKELVDKRWIPPIICICNNRYDKKIAKLKKDCEEIIFNKPNEADLLQLTNRICKAEQVCISDEGKKMIASYAQGDFRRLLLLLQNLSIVLGREKCIVEEDIIAHYQLFCQKDIELSTRDMGYQLLNRNLTPADALKIYELDKSLLPMMIHENYVDAISLQTAPSVFCQLQAIQDSIDTIIEGDILDKTMYNNQSWYLQPNHGLCSCYIPATYINKYKKVQFKSSEFTTAFGKFSLQCSNRKSINSLIGSLNGKNSYTIDDIRVLSELILYYAFINEVPGRNRPKVVVETAGTLQICVDLLKKYGLEVDDLDKLIKLNKLDNFYKNINSLGRTKTALKKLYGDVEVKSRTKKNLNVSNSAMTAVEESSDRESDTESAPKKKRETKPKEKKIPATAPKRQIPVIKKLTPD